MMSGATGFDGLLENLFKLQQSSGFARSCVSIPGCGSVVPNEALGYRLLQCGKCGFKAAVEFIFVKFVELRFGVVDVVDVESFQAEIFAAFIDLVGEVRGRHTVGTGGDVIWSDDSGSYESVPHPSSRIGRIGGIETEKASFGADDKFLAAESVVGQVAKSSANSAFASLETVVYGGVNEVAADGYGAGNRIFVGLVGGGVGVTQIGSNADGGCAKAHDVAKMRGLQFREAVFVV